MKKILLFSGLILFAFSCVEKEEINIPEELVGKWEKEFETAESKLTNTFVFKSNGTYESFSYRNIQSDDLRAGFLGYSTGNFSEREGNLLMSNIRSFYAEDDSNPPSEVSLLKEQLEWVIPDRLAEFSLEENGSVLVLTFLGCDDVPTPRESSANCAPPTPISYNRVVE